MGDGDQVVCLTYPEIYAASMLGVMRQLAALQNGCADLHGVKPEDGFKVHILGACGEFAVAKLLGDYFPLTVNTYQSGQDVGGKWQVRTRARDDYDLIVRDGDRDDDRFVLVVGIPPELRVCGWILGGEAKQAKWRQNYGGRGEAWFVPKNALKPMSRT